MRWREGVLVADTDYVILWVTARSGPRHGGGEFARRRLFVGRVDVIGWCCCGGELLLEIREPRG